MAVSTRVIVTSQPDVPCDVCGRRLLRGEQPDTFLADGRRRTVCELCAPSASVAGWVRETADPDVNLPPARPRRGRNLLGRLRQARERPGSAARSPSVAAAPVPAPAPSETARPVPAVPCSATEPVPEPEPAPVLSEADEIATAGPGAAPDVAAPVREPAEEERGSWRDAWMFVKE
jgi:hypothetical protein